MIERIEEKDLDEVVDIHLSVLGYTFNARLGRKHLLKLYLLTINSPNGVGFVYKNRDQVVGFVSGSYNVNELQKELLRGFSLQDKLNILFKIITRPCLLPKFLRSSVSDPKIVYGGHKVSANLLTIGVKPGYTRQGIGKLLTEALSQDFQTRGIYSFYLFTEKDNLRANSFYESLGFNCIHLLSKRHVYLQQLQSKPSPLKASPPKLRDND